MNWKVEEIGYFDFLRMFPNIINEDHLSGVNMIDYINYVENMHKNKLEKKPIIRIDKEKLSNAVLNYIKTKEEKNDIFRGYLHIAIDGDLMFFIKPTNNLLSYERNNLRELEGEFSINELHQPNYYNFDEKELKNLKRDLLIEKCLDEN